MKTSLKNIAAVAILLAYAATAHAQLKGSALNYMLQRPRVAKQYADKQLWAMKTDTHNSGKQKQRGSPRPK